MAKLAVLFVLAILALQNTNATVNIELPEGVTSFSDKIKEVVAKHNTEPVIEELKKEVEALLATNDKDERLCGPKAHEFIAALVKDSQADVGVCVNYAEDAAKYLQDQLTLLGEHTKAVSELLEDKISECSKQHPRDVLGFAACVEEHTKDLRQNLEQLDLEMAQMLSLTLQTIKEALKELDVCLAKTENKVTLEGRAIVSGLNQCIQNVDMLYTRSLPNKINEIIVKHNVDAVITELKKEVEYLLSFGDRIERFCGSETHNLVEALAKEVHNEAEQCFVQFSDDLEKFDICLAKVENKATLEGRAIVSSLNQCIQNVGMLYVKSSPNKVNEIIVKHNVDAVIMELKKEVEYLLSFGDRIERLCGSETHNLVEALAKEVHNEAEQCFVKFSSDLEQFDICLAKVENKATLDGRAIVSSLNQCIQNVGMLYSRSLPNEVNEIVGKHNVDAVIRELENEVEDLLTRGEKIERLCGPKAHGLVKALAHKAQNDAAQCLTSVKSSNSLEQIDLCLAKVENKATLESRAVVAGVNQCIQNVGMARMWSEEISEVVFKHNVEALVEGLKNDVEQLLAMNEKGERLCGSKTNEYIEKLFEDSLLDVDQCLATMSSPNDFKELDVCLAKVENKVSLEGRAIISGLNQCVRNADLLFTRSLPGQMSTIVAEHNLKSIFAEMKNEVEKLLAASEKNERLCGPKTHKIVELVEKNSQVEAGLCATMLSESLMPPQVALNEVNMCLTRVEQRIVSQRNVIVEGLYKCIHNAEMLY